MLVTQINGTQLRCARVCAGLTLDQLAERSGVTRQAIGVWELSSDAIPAARIDKIGRVITVLESEGVRFIDGGIQRVSPRTVAASAAPAIQIGAA